MDIDKLLVNFRRMFTGTDHAGTSILFVCELLPYVGQVWRDGPLPGYHLAFTDKEVIVGFSPRKAKFISQDSINLIEIRTELAPIHGKKDFTFFRAFSKTQEVDFSLRIKPEHVESLWKFLRERFPESRLRRVSISEDQWNDERRKNVQVALQEMANDGSFGKPLKLLGDFEEDESRIFGEFKLSFAPEFQDLSEIENQPLRLQVLERQVSGVLDLMPDGEQVLVFSKSKNARGISQLNFVSNRRIVFDASSVDGVIYASEEVGLSQLSALNLIGGELVATLETGEDFTAGTLSTQAFARLYSIMQARKIEETEDIEETATSLVVKENAFATLNRTSRDELHRLGRGEEPKVILITRAGVFAAWHDRLAIVKQGAYRALTFSGHKQGTQEFYFRDILQINIESRGIYLSVYSVVQVITPGHPHRDLTDLHFQNVGRYPNVLLVSSGIQTGNALAEIQELWRTYKERESNPDAGKQISEDNRGGDLAEQLKSLKDLFVSGHLTGEEYARAKAKLLD